MTKRIPNKWKTGVIITLPKKGDLTQRKNWRGITLLNSINKLLASIIHGRLLPFIDQLVRQNQAGFRPGKSCTDQTNTVRILIEESVEKQKPLFLLFVDFERAFDTLDRSAIWNALRTKGVPNDLILLIKELYANARVKVRRNGAKGEEFETTDGVRQGCVLSPLLFLIALEIVLQQTNAEANFGLQ